MYGRYRLPPQYQRAPHREWSVHLTQIHWRSQCLLQLPIQSPRTSDTLSSTFQVISARHYSR